VNRSRRMIVLTAIAAGVVLAIAMGIVALRSPAARAHRHWRQANAFLKAERYADAIIVLQNIVRADPRSAQAYLQLGRAYLRLHHYRQAFQAFSHAVTRDPDLQEAQLWIGRFQLLSGKFNEARDKAQLILRKEPPNTQGSSVWAQSYLVQNDVNPHTPFRAEAYLLLGDVLLAQGKVRDALNQYGSAEDLIPDEPRFHYAMGRAHTLAKQYDQALREFEETLSLDPNRVDALAGVVSVYWTNGNRSHAFSRVREQIEEFPSNPQLHNLLGTLYLSAGEVTHAEQSFAAALRINPKIPTSYLLLGDVYAKTSRYDLATKKYEEALRVDPTNGLAYQQLGIVQGLQNHLDAAIGSFAKAVELNPSLAPALNNLARYYAEVREDLAAAETYAARALALAPHDPLVLDTQGWILYRQGQYDAAVRYLWESAHSLKGRPVILYHLGMAHLRAGRKDLARTELAEALSHRQDFPGAHEARTALLGLR
jgi:tetratricopeptide (TPR) repeat protein